MRRPAWAVGQTRSLHLYSTRPARKSDVSNSQALTLLLFFSAPCAPAASQGALPQHSWKVASGANRCWPESSLQSIRSMTYCRTSGGHTPAPWSVRSIGKPLQRSSWRAATGRRSSGADGGSGGCSRACRSGLDALPAARIDSPQDGSQRRSGRQQHLSARGLGIGIACAAARNDRSRLAADQVAAARAFGARWTLRTPDMSVAAGITVRCGSGGRWG